MDRQEERLTTLIKELVLKTEGRISYAFIDKELDIVTPEGKATRRAVFEELCKKGIVRREEKLTGVFWHIDGVAPKIDWQHADPKNVIKLKFPFELERWVKVFPKSIIIVAGEKQSAKTLFCDELVLKNMNHKLGIDLFNSETGKEQMRERFDNFDIEIPNPAPFNVYERYSNFADVIDPNRISVIDYLDLNSEVYLVGDEIDRLFRRTNTVVIIALQVPPPQKIMVRGVEKLLHRDLAWGGGFTSKRAILYLTMWATGTRSGQLKIKYCKSPLNPNIHPENMQWKFRVNSTGTKFIVEDNEETMFPFGEEGD